MIRPSWDTYFLQMAHLVSTRSTCLRRQVGAVIVKDNRILATGYNGAPSGLPHCDEVGCLRTEQGIPSGERHELCRALHAEQNALLQAAIHGVSVQGCDIYLTCQPCIICAKMLVQVGVKRVVFTGDYPDGLAMDMFKESDMQLVQVERRHKDGVCLKSKTCRHFS